MERALIVLLLLSFTTLIVCQCDSYIAPDGSDDTGVGTADRPYETLDKGFHAIPLATKQHEWHICAKPGVYNYNELQRQVVWQTGHGKVDTIWIIPANATDARPTFPDQLVLYMNNVLELHIEGIKFSLQIIGEKQYPLALSIYNSEFVDDLWAIEAFEPVRGTLDIDNTDFGQTVLGLKATKFDLTLHDTTITNPTFMAFSSLSMKFNKVKTQGTQFEITTDYFNVTDSSFADCNKCPTPVITALIGVNEGANYGFVMSNTVFSDNNIPKFVLKLQPNYTLIDKEPEKKMTFHVNNVAFFNNTESIDPDPPFNLVGYGDNEKLFDLNVTALHFSPQGHCDSMGQFSFFHLLQCENCDPGTFSPILNASVCLPCPLGTYANANQSQVCFGCPPGTVANKTGTIDCHPCSAGLIPKSDQTACLPCESGSKQVGVECKPCGFGFTSYQGTDYCIVQQWIIGLFVGIILVAVLGVLVYLSRDVVFASCRKRSETEVIHYSPINEAAGEQDDI